MSLEKILVGLTGNIASGKSEAGSMFEGLGAYVIDTDKLGHEAYKKSFYLKFRVLTAFGLSVFKPNLDIDRAELGEIVFNDEKKRQKLNSIVWPYIGYMLYKKVKKADKKIVVIESALLFEAGWEKMLDYTITVTCEDSLRLERLMKRSNLTEENAKKMLKSQMGQYEKAAKSDYTIANNDDLSHLLNSVKAIWDDLQKK